MASDRRTGKPCAPHRATAAPTRDVQFVQTAAGRRSRPADRPGRPGDGAGTSIASTAVTARDRCTSGSPARRS